MNGQVFFDCLAEIVGMENAKRYCLRFGPLDDLLSGSISNFEALAVYAYSTELNWHQRINEELWSGSPSHEVRLFAEVLNGTLAKLPPYTMNDRRVYRGYRTKDLSAFIARHAEGAIVHHPAFTSASFKPELAFGGNVFFIIKTLTGKAIWYLAANYQEFEVLIPAARSFQIVSLVVREDRAQIIMDELP